jgi:hypothetical protein
MGHVEIDRFLRRRRHVESDGLNARAHEHNSATPIAASRRQQSDDMVPVSVVRSRLRRDGTGWRIYLVDTAWTEPGVLDVTPENAGCCSGRSERGYRIGRGGA